MNECRYITKNGTNSFHNYTYVTSADVLDKVNHALSSVGLVTTVKPELLDFREVTTAKGSTDKHATVSVTVTIFDCDTKESITLSGIGSGQDSGDKAIMKAETAAIKYAYMLSLCIATGDDPEADITVDKNMQVNAAAAAPRAKVATPKASTLAAPQAQSNDSLYCSDCGAQISEKVYSYSMKNQGAALCMQCQKQHKIA